jgi:hypothetical protein
VRQFHIRIIATHADDYLTPQRAGFEDIRFVDGANFFAALAGKLKRGMPDALYFRFL